MSQMAAAAAAYCHLGNAVDAVVAVATSRFLSHLSHLKAYGKSGSNFGNGKTRFCAEFAIPETPTQISNIR